MLFRIQYGESDTRIIPHNESLHLTSSHSHLPSLASEASHALLSPFRTHAAINPHEKGDGIHVFKDIVKASVFG